MNAPGRIAALALSTLIALARPTAQSGIPGSPWPASTPSREGLSAGPVLDMLEWMRGSGLEFHSLVIVKNGKLVASAGFDPFDPALPQNVYSCTKSFLSSLVGIALAERRFPALDSKVAKYLPEYDFGKPADPKRRVTFEQLITHSSGYPPVYSWDFERVVDTEAYVAHKALVTEPGSAFAYNSGTLNLVSAALQKATGMKAADYAASRLFAPLGIREWAWSGDGAGVTTGGTNLCVSAMDLAKLGWLWLRGGDWFGTRVVPADWVARATEARFKPVDMNRAEACGYGYLWWIDEWGGFSSHGSAGQFCFVVPEHDLVVVFTAALPADKFPVPWDLMKRYILPAAASGREAPPDDAADAAFASIAAARAPREHGLLPLPAMAANVSLRRFSCGKNPIELDGFSLDFSEAGKARVTMWNSGAEGEPGSIDASLRGTFALGSADGALMAARGEWIDERAFRLEVFDMKALMEITVRFDGSGEAKVRARSAAYAMDSEWDAWAR